MNAFARIRLEGAVDKIRIVEGVLGASAQCASDRHLVQLLHRALGDLLAMEQLLAMEEAITETRATASTPPIPLRVVRT